MPISITTSSAVIPTISQSRQLLLPAVLDRMQKGDLTAQQAWDDKLIDVYDLLWIFANKVDTWGGFYWEKNLLLRRDLEKVLAENGGEKLVNPEKLPPTVRLWMADYYESIGDSKCLPLSESILTEIKSPSKGEGALAFQAVERIAWFYNDKGEFKKAIESWQRAPNYLLDQNLLTDVTLKCARLYNRLGDADKAEQLFFQVIEQGAPTAAASALAEMIQTKILQGKRQDAFGLMDRLIKQATPTKTIDISNVMASSELGQLYLLQGDLSRAKDYYEQTIIQSQQLSSPSTIASVGRTALDAKEKLNSIAQQKDLRIVCDPSEIIILLDGDQADEQKVEKITRRFLISTSLKCSISVFSENPGVKILSVEDSPWMEDEQPFKFERQAIIQIEPAILNHNIPVVLKVTSPEIPNLQTQILVNVLKAEKNNEGGNETKP